MQSRHSSALRVALGAAVRAERAKLEWSQEELAERAGMHRAYVTDLENGKRTPNFDTLLRLSHALGMKLSRLIAAGEARLAERG